MENEDYCLLFRAVNERSFQVVEIRSLVSEIVEFVVGGRVLGGFVKLERAVTRRPVVLIRVEVEAVEVWKAAVHTLDHLLLKVKKGGVVERDPNVAGEG